MMNLQKEKWSKEDYQEYIEYLKNLKDEKNQLFMKKTVTTKYEMLGIKMPIQRKIAKEIQKGNVVSFLSNCQNNYYEEVMIAGFIIASLQEQDFAKYLPSFLPKIDNWAICDSFCNSVKCISKNKEKYLNKIQDFLNSPYEYTVRVSLVLLLNFYVEENHIPKILSLVDNLNREEYYINMAAAWLLAECYIKAKEITLPYLKQNHLSKFVQNKTISKICDSYRVTKEEKDALKKLRYK